MIANFEKGLDGPKACKQPMALASLCIGGMAVARALDDRALADEIRDAAKDLATALASSHERPAVVAAE
jgi:TetR/AcrR family transcriptional repressor of nem operon